MTACWSGRAAPALMLSWAALTCGAAVAQTVSRVSANAAVSVNALNLPLENANRDSHQLTGPTATVVPADASALRPLAGAGTAFGRAGYGVLSAYTDITVQNLTPPQLPGGNGQTQSHAEGGADVRFTDVLTVDGGALNGTQGTVRVPWLITGAGASATDHDPSATVHSAGEGADAYWRFYVTVSKPTGELVAEVEGVGTASAHGGSVQQSSTSRHWLANAGWVTDSSTAMGGLPPLWDLIPITFGAPMVVSAVLYTDLSATATNVGLPAGDPSFDQLRSAEATVDLAHTLRWGGVTQVLDAQGLAVSGWRVSAASGTDYSRAITTSTTVSAVPEPGTGLMALLGLIVLLWPTIAAQFTEQAQRRHPWPANPRVTRRTASGPTPPT